MRGMLRKNGRAAVRLHRGLLNTTSLASGDAQLAKRFGVRREAKRHALWMDGTNVDPPSFPCARSRSQGRIQSAVVAGALPAHSKR